MSLYLDIKYLNLVAPQLNRFVRKSDSTWNFRCPFCGDSSKKKQKARGYFFQKNDSLIYHCHNCSHGCNLQNFLKFVSGSLYDSYVMEKFIDDSSCITQPGIVPSPKVKPNTSCLDLERLSDLPKSHPGRAYAEDRLIPQDKLELLYYIEDFGTWAEKITEGTFNNKYKSPTPESRIVIPFYNRQAELIALQGRAIDKSAKIRYITLKFSDEPKIFGMERWNSNKTTYVLEGPLDSLFLPNALAMAGTKVDIDSIFDDKENTVFIYDNEPRNKDICRLMTSVINKGYSIFIWKYSIIEKDINEMILHGYTPEKVLKIIQENTCKGLDALLNATSWFKC